MADYCSGISVPLAVACGAEPRNEQILTEQDLGMTSEQLAQALSSATRTANYHTRPPPSEDRSHERKSSSNTDRFKLTCVGPSSQSISSSSSAAASLVKASGLVSAIHLGIFFRAFMQNNVIITGDVLEQLIVMCVSNEPEWVHKVQQTALAFVFDLMESKGDASVLQRHIGTLVHIPTVSCPSSYAAGSSGGGGSSSGGGTSVDDIAYLAQLKAHSTIVNAPSSQCPDVVLSCTHFRFIIDANSLSANDSTVDFSAQVRITNSGKCPVNVRVAQEITIIDGYVIPAAVDQQLPSGGAEGSRGEEKAGEDSEGQSTPRQGDRSSVSKPSAGMSPQLKEAINNSKHTDSQILLERAYLKKGESSRLLISFLAKSSATFNTYTKMLVLVVHECVKVVVTFAVINPMQPLFGVPFPSCVPLPVVESPIGCYEAPLILQVIKHHFQIMGGFGWREVAAMLSTSCVNPHSRVASGVVHERGAGKHPSQTSSSPYEGAVDSTVASRLPRTLSQKVLLEAIALRNRLCEEWPCGALLPKLWQHGMNGSILTMATLGVPSPSPGIAPAPVSPAAVHFNSATSSTLKPRATVPVSSSSPIGYTAGSVRPAGGGAAVYNNTNTNISAVGIGITTSTSTNTPQARSGAVHSRSLSLLSNGTNTVPTTGAGSTDTAASSSIPSPSNNSNAAVTSNISEAGAPASDEADGSPSSRQQTSGAACSSAYSSALLAACANIPSTTQQQALVTGCLRLDLLTAAQPQTLFALVLLWFAEFPTPILDTSLTMCDPCVYLHTMQPHLQHLMAWLIDFCCSFLVHSDANGTSVRNLALTFSPLLMDHSRCVVAQSQSPNGNEGSTGTQGSGYSGVINRESLAFAGLDGGCSDGGYKHIVSAATTPSKVAPTVVAGTSQVLFPSTAATLGSTSSNPPLPTVGAPLFRSGAPSSKPVIDDSDGGRRGAEDYGYGNTNDGVNEGGRDDERDGEDDDGLLEVTYSSAFYAVRDHTNRRAGTLEGYARADPYSDVGGGDDHMAFSERLSAVRDGSGRAAEAGLSWGGVAKRLPLSEPSEQRFPTQQQCGVPHDALYRDMTLMLHSTTALIHWLKKYQPMYSKASAAAAAAAANSAAVAAAVSPSVGASSATPVSRPLSPLAGPLPSPSY